jgi:hypothetical protein
VGFALVGRWRTFLKLKRNEMKKRKKGGEKAEDVAYRPGETL